MHDAKRRDDSAGTARRRLLDDQSLRPIVEQRLRLERLAQRFDQVGRQALIGLLSARVKTDPRYRPVLQKLLRIPGRSLSPPS